MIERSLGPSAAWLRAALPLCLTPMLLQPLTIDMPSAESASKFIALTAGSALGTMWLAGTLAERVMKPAAHAATGIVAGAAAPPPSVAAAASAAARAIVSLRVAGALVLVGASVSALAATVIDDAVLIRAPLYAAATSAVYVAAGNAIVPAPIRAVLPPTVCSAAALAVSTLAFGAGTSEVDVYLRGGGAMLMGVVSPALGTLGLLAHTHRAMLVRNKWGLALVVGVTAPLGMLGTALAGRYILRLPPSETAAVMPATTTTGLAVTMGPSIPFAKQEWIVLGPNIMGVSGMVIWPLLLRATAMGGKIPLVRGIALGSVAHVGVMAALLGAGHVLASEAAAIAFFLLGTTRCVLLATPFADVLAAACGARSSVGADANPVAAFGAVRGPRSDHS